MHNDVKAEIHACATASYEGRISFGDVVNRLSAVGVERYLVDFVRNETTYYLPSGESEIVRGHQTATPPAHDFSPEGVVAAVRGAQAGALAYPAFCEQALTAGCVGYIASMAGKRVVYYGRTGDSHVEYFPGSRP